MTKLICFYSRRYLVHLIIFLIATFSFLYLIMVSTPNKDPGMTYRKFDLRDLNAMANDYESHKNAVKNTVHSSQFQKHAQEMEVKVILIWSPLFKDWNFLTFGMNSFKGSGCPETRCEITSDRRRLMESQAVLFHVRTLSMLDIPRNRTQGQKWIFFSLEAPPYSRFQGFDFMINMFNWTMTYRDDSDVVIPYGRIVPKNNNNTFRISDLHRKWQRKTKMAVWMVSHCSTDGNREKYIDRLRVFVDVDTYGGCGFASCPFNKTDLCMEEFSKQYYFFLGFENAICDDYITEKLFRTLQYDMIPVVFGGGNYSSVAPSRSFIDALSFASPKQLANQMFQIASNFTHFSSYFQWRSKEYSDDVPNHCGLCQKLHSESFEKHSVYGDINDWWINKSHCKTWRSE